MENELENKAIETETKPRKSKPKDPLLVSCARFRYIGKENMILKDAYGAGYALTPNCEIIVPSGSLERHCAYRKTLFERMK